METSLVITALVAVIWNLIIKDEVSEETESLGEDEVPEDETFQVASDTAGMKVAGSEAMGESKGGMSAE